MEPNSADGGAMSKPEPDDLPELEAERLAAVLAGENDPGYDPDDSEQGVIVEDDDPDEPNVKAGH